MTDRSIPPSAPFPSAQVIVKCPRTGGAFGGKIFRGIPVSCAAALASTKLSRPVRIFNTRTADMAQQSTCTCLF
jgi:xanthine dehydrogenase molybdopterin-binding subunit B